MVLCLLYRSNNLQNTIWDLRRDSIFYSVNEKYRPTHERSASSKDDWNADYVNTRVSLPPFPVSKARAM
jgi:hypothetical protein